MRMTRAALRAQAQADEQAEFEPPSYAEEETVSRKQGPTLIHQDPIDIEAEIEPETETHNSFDLPVRPALRDITDENYPQTDPFVEPQSQSPVKALQALQEEPELRKSTRKGRKARTKKTEAPTAVENDVETIRGEVERSTEGEATKEAETSVGEDPIQYTSKQSEEQTAQGSAESREVPPVESGLAVDEDSLFERLPIEAENLGSKPPRFDPSIHITEELAGTTEDSFVQSITSRSPAKFTQSQSRSDELQRTASGTSSLHADPTLRRKSSTNFEESFEAMDSLEDTIEQMTAGLPILPAEAMHSPESPIRIDQESLKPHQGSHTPNRSAAARPPRSASSKLQAVLKANDKENTPPAAQTPLSKQKTPLKTKTPTTKQPSPLKSRTPAAKPTSSARPPGPSARKSTAIRGDPIKRPAPPSEAPKANRKSAVVSNAPKPAPVSKKPTVPLQRKPIIHQQTLAKNTNTKPEPKRHTSTSDVERHQASRSFSSSPATLQPNLHKRRVTSGGILSTSKPGFVPAKSSKPTTTSTFTLPSEAIAEKLKAQKEAREERMKTQSAKMTLAEQKAARLKAEREAREERVRLNQQQRTQSKAQETDKAQKMVKLPGDVAVKKARAEAAERGRQASREWAAKMLKKKQAETATATAAS